MLKVDPAVERWKEAGQPGREAWTAVSHTAMMDDQTPCPLPVWSSYLLWILISSLWPLLG